MSRFALALLAVLSLAPSASGQGREPSRVQRAVVVVAGTAAAVGAATGAAVLLGQDNDDRTGVTLVVLSYAGGMALGTSAAAGALGLDAPLDRTSADAALGVAAGAVAGAVVGLAVGGTAYLIAGRQEWDLVSPLVGAGAGAITALSVSAMVASRRVEAPGGVAVAPAAFRAPTGEPGAGLSLRVSL